MSHRFSPARLKAARLAAGLTQEQVARARGCHPMTVSKWETGVVTPTVSTLLAVAELYGVPVEQLCDDDSLPVGA